MKFKPNRYLQNREFLRVSDHEEFRVEAEAQFCDQGHASAHVIRMRGFQSGLDVVDARNQEHAHEQVEEAAHDMPRRNVFERVWAYQVLGFRMNPARNGNAAWCRFLAHAINVGQVIRKVYIRIAHQVRLNEFKPVTDGSAFSPVFGILDISQTIGVPGRLYEFVESCHRIVATAIINEDYVHRRMVIQIIE